MSKKKCPEFENHERWLVSYADMVTLLFAVFVVLFALKKDGAKSSQEAAGSLQESFNKPLEDIPEAHRIGPREAGFGIFEHFRGNSIREPVIKKFPGADEQQIKIIEQEMNRVRLELEERLYGPNKHRESTDPGQARIVSVQRTTDGFLLRLLARHFYDPGDIRIKRSALKDLDTVTKIVKELGRPVTIQGHTDSVPPRKMSNWDLSALRATHVLRYMLREHNFPPTKLAAAGYADTRPLASNATESGRAMNRRIEIKIDYDQDASVGPTE